MRVPVSVPEPVCLPLHVLVSVREPWRVPVPVQEKNSGRIDMAMSGVGACAVLVPLAVSMPVPVPVTVRVPVTVTPC